MCANEQTPGNPRRYGPLPRQPAGRSLSIRTTPHVAVRAVTAQSLTQGKRMSNITRKLVKNDMHLK